MFYVSINESTPIYRWKVFTNEHPMWWYKTIPQGQVTQVTQGHQGHRITKHVIEIWIFHVPLWLFKIAMENSPFIDDQHEDLSIQNGEFP